MRIGDLKRAVEDVILRPDQNTLNDLDKRDTIAALDLCQPEPSPPLPACAPSAASMNACSCSSETVPVDVPRPPPPLCTSTSLDTIVNRPQPLLHRHSSGVSRRQSRVLSTLQSKRKRSNSLTNYQKTSGTSVSLPPSARQTPMRFGDDDAQRTFLEDNCGEINKVAKRAGTSRVNCDNGSLISGKEQQIGKSSSACSREANTASITVAVYSLKTTSEYGHEYKMYVYIAVAGDVL
ncbi:hypothetical protein KIN20_035128 [Parelaphostrongylus tenuis]|uniref:Uncharacterized protein n=1 Tax=Parelaphostrongylus tenuis TaxID=148309 RepID=A0AAD5WJG2_PARTN|nr:hypothetical protein KIN20_035128 [Parelaphostrongylus tenuis]